MTRRTLLMAGGTLGLAAVCPRLLFARTGGRGRLLVVILRGALDGLAATPPFADPDYADLRGELALAAPGSHGGVLPLDAFFGLHPALAFLHERFVAGQLLVLHAIASPYRDRSHFDGQNVLENGLAHPIGSADGWLNRALVALPGNTTRLERAVAVSQNVPLLLRGPAPVLTKSPAATPDIDDELLTRLGDLYSKDAWFATRLSAGIQTNKLSNGNDSMTARAGARQLETTASIAAGLMRSENGPEVAVIEATGWDTHANQGASEGLLAQRLTGLDEALRTYSDGMATLWPQTAVLVVTEFGRTVAVNGTRGTDHGTATCAFLLGGAIRGGRVQADWPGLGHSALLDYRDLRPTADLRSLFKGVLIEHMDLDARSAARVFPDSNGARPIKDLIRA